MLYDQSPRFKNFGSRRYSLNPNLRPNLRPNSDDILCHVIDSCKINVISVWIYLLYNHLFITQNIKIIIDCFCKLKVLTNSLLKKSWTKFNEYTLFNYVHFFYNWFCVTDFCIEIIFNLRSIEEVDPSLTILKKFN